jgi:ribosomal protein L30E
VWITATREAAERALRDRSIQRAFRGDAEVDAELPGLIDRLLERSVLEGLSLANKAGQVVTGAAKVESSLSAGAVALLIHASDAQPDGVRKIDALARASGERLPVLRALRGEQLDLALGRPNVVHAALLAHPAGAGFLGRCLRLDRWRNGEAAVADRGTAG